ncbi:MAG: MFS transporter [Bacteroidales bacterium]|nr:MFS transporter [Bacteroidales bacterium]
MENKTQNRNWVAIITMFALFAMVGFVTNLAAPFGNIWGFKYESAGMLGNLMNFTAYLFMGIPAGNMLTTVGYKKTALIGMCVGVVGLFIQYLSSVFGADTLVYGDYALNLFIYLLGALVCGFSVCMLNTVVNPMLNLLGGGGKVGNQLLQLGGACNSLAGTLAPYLAGALIGTITAETAMNDVTPLLFIGIGIFVVAIIVIGSLKIEEPQANLSQVTFEHSPIAFRHCLLGVIAIFFYVGVEVGIPAQLNFYVSNMSFEGAAAVGGSLAAIYWLLMLCGRLASGSLLGNVSSKTQLTYASSIAIVLLLVAVFLPESITINLYGGDVPLKCLFIFLCGLCTSVMWGGIFNLATEGLGKYTAKASGLFMAMVVGGGVMPYLQDLIGVNVGRIASYWLAIAMLAYILFYAVVGSKNVNKDIPVE